MNDNKFNFKNALLLTAAVAVLVVIAMMYKGGKTEAVHIEINQSIAISANRLGNVINCYPLNEEGESIVKSIDAEGKKYNDVIESLLNKAVENGQQKKGDRISVRLQTEESSLNNKHSHIEEKVKNAVSAASMSAQCREFDRGIIKSANSYGIAVGKYRMICEMQKMNSSIKIDTYKDYSLDMLKTIYNELKSGKTKEEAEQESGAKSGGIKETINKILYESEKAE